MFVPRIHPNALDRIDSIESRLRLMVAYLQLQSRGVIDQPLPQSCYVNALRDASPVHRARIAVALLDLKEQSPNFDPKIPTDLLALTIYESDDPDELSMRVPWTKSILGAIAERESGKIRTIPYELRIRKRKQAELEQSHKAPQLRLEALLRLRANELGQMLENYRLLWNGGVIDSAPPPEIMTHALSTVTNPHERIASAYWAYEAGMLEGRMLDAVLLGGLDEIADPVARVESQIWYLDMLGSGVVHTPLRAGAIVHSMREALTQNRVHHFHQLVERLPAELLANPTVQQMLTDASAQQPQPAVPVGC